MEHYYQQKMSLNLYKLLYLNDKVLINTANAYFELNLYKLLYLNLGDNLIVKSAEID